MKKAASSPSLPIHKLATASSSPKLQKKQSWYDNLRQKKFKKSTHICKVKCGVRRGKHKCRYVYVYWPGVNDRHLLCTKMIEPCSEETNHVQLRFQKRTVIISEPKGSAYTIRNKRTRQRHISARGDWNLMYDPVAGDEPHAQCFSQIGIKRKFHSRKPAIMIDVADKRDNEQKAIADLIDLVKTRQRNTKRILAEWNYADDMDTNANVLSCSQQTEYKPDICEMQTQGRAIECNVDNAIGGISGRVTTTTQSSVNMDGPEIEKLAVGTSKNINTGRPDDKNCMNNNNNDVLTATKIEDYSGSVDNSNIDRKQNALVMQELNYKGTDSSMAAKVTPNGPREGSVYSDCYLSSSGLTENFELDKLNRNIAPDIVVHQNSPRKNVSLNLEVPQRSKRLKMQDPNEDLSKLDCGQYLDVDQSSLDGASSDVTEGSDDGWRKRRKDSGMDEGKMSSFYSYHVAASLVNNSSAIMLLIDHKM